MRLLYVVLYQGGGKADIYVTDLLLQNPWWGMGIPECINESAADGFEVNSYQATCSINCIKLAGLGN